MRSIYHHSQFKKVYKLMVKRKCAIEELDNVIEMLANDETLDVKYCDHPLQGDKNNTRDCHIQNDWILFYIKKVNMNCSWSAPELTQTCLSN